MNVLLKQYHVLRVLLVPPHLGCSGQSPKSRKMVVCVSVCVCVCPGKMIFTFLHLWIALTHRHIDTHYCFTALCILSGTTWVSQYQTKYLSTDTVMVMNHHLSVSFISFDPWNPSCSIHVPDYPSPQSVSKFSLVYLLACSFHFILHALLHPIVVFFCNTCPYYRNLFCCSSKIMSSNPSFSLNTTWNCVF